MTREEAEKIVHVFMAVELHGTGFHYNKSDKVRAALISLVLKTSRDELNAIQKALDARRDPPPVPAPSKPVLVSPPKVA